jgi:triosephosphate isomerase (TIM)
VHTITAPFFEIGPKNLLRRPELEALSAAAASAAAEFQVATIVTVPAPLISIIKERNPNLYVFSQQMDDDGIGPTVGRITPEALVDSGADGVMLNHVAHPLDWVTLVELIGRAHEVGLTSMVCVGSLGEALRVAAWEPDIVLYEPPELIGRAHTGSRDWIRPANQAIKEVNPRVLRMHAGGVSKPADAQAIMASGADGTGSTSGVVFAIDPAAAAHAFIRAVREGANSASSSQRIERSTNVNS